VNNPDGSVLDRVLAEYGKKTNSYGIGPQAVGPSWEYPSGL
jgi:hypothetical protein